MTRAYPPTFCEKPRAQQNDSLVNSAAADDSHLPKLAATPMHISLHAQLLFRAACWSLFALLTTPAATLQPHPYDARRITPWKASHHVHDALPHTCCQVSTQPQPQPIRILKQQQPAAAVQRTACAAAPWLPKIPPACMRRPPCTLRAAARARFGHSMMRLLPCALRMLAATQALSTAQTTTKSSDCLSLPGCCAAMQLPLW